MPAQPVVILDGSGALAVRALTAVGEASLAAGVAVPGLHRLGGGMIRRLARFQTAAGQPGMAFGMYYALLFGMTDWLRRPGAEATTPDKYLLAGTCRLIYHDQHGRGKS